MKNWKRIIAAAGAAALLISNLGATGQTAYAETTSTENTEQTGSTEGTGTTITLDVNDLVGGTAVEGSAGTDGQDTSASAGETPAGQINEGGSASTGTGEGAETGNTEGSAQTGSETAGGEQTDTAGKTESTDGTTTGNPDAESKETTGTKVLICTEDHEHTDDCYKIEQTEGSKEEKKVEEKSDEEQKESEAYALTDSIALTLETKESETQDPATSEEGDYLYALGESAETTLTISNPEAYLVSEDDGAVIRLYMQVTDAAASTNEDGVPYKETTKKADDASAEDGDEAADAEDNASEDADKAEADNKASAIEVTCEGNAIEIGSHTLTAESGNDYSYSIVEVEDDLYMYEIARPMNGDTITLQLTSTYGEQTNGGENELWVVALTKDEAEELDQAAAEKAAAKAESENADADEASNDDESDAPVYGVASRPEDDARYDVLCWLNDEEIAFTHRETTQTKETENYKVSVTYRADSKLPADAELKVTEYGTDSAEYKRVCEETGQTYDWLLDISFYYNDRELEPQAPIDIKVTALTPVVEETGDTSDDAVSNDGISMASLDDEDVDASNDESADGSESSKTSAIEDTITTITHFADAGTEVLEDHEIDVQETAEGLVETSFSLNSLSLVAGQTYHKATVVNYSTAENSNNGTFLIYKVDDGKVYFLVYNSGSLATLETTVQNLLPNVDKDTIETSDLVNLDKLVYFRDTVSGTIDGVSATLSWSSLCWNKYQGYALRSAANTSAYLAIGLYHQSTLGLSWGTPYTISFKQGSQERYSSLYRQVTGWNYSDDYSIGFKNGKFVIHDSSSSGYTSLTLAQVGDDYTKPAEAKGGSTAVYTGEIDTLPLGFYTVRIADNKLQPIGQVTYTIYKRASGTDENGRPNKGDVVAYITTTSDDMHIDMPTAVTSNPGDYVMEMTQVPDGYVCDDGYWTFTITSGQLVLDLKNENSDSEGVIVVNPKENLEMSKTASVYDYANRVYQVDLTAHSSLQQGSFEPLNIHLVLDQSNSMLFPSGLKEVSGVGLKVYYQSDNTTYAEIQNESKLDKNKVYYLITSPSSSATVWALWYDGSKWNYQDASYYALATYKDEFGDSSKSESERYKHIRSSNTLAKFPYQDDFKGNTKSGDTYTEFVSGGRIVYTNRSKSNVKGAFNSEVSSSNTTTTLTIYEAEGEYNRLHYLEESVCQMLQMLAAMNPYTKVTVDGFYSTPAHCSGTTPYTLDNTGLQNLLTKITDITTEGGTRQDLALKHTYDTHFGSNEYKDKDHEYVILITDGAPAGLSSSNLGSATDTVGNIDGNISSSNTVYMRLNDIADKIKNKATLATVGLSMKNVTSGRKALAHISTDGPSVNNVSGTQGEWWFQPEQGSELGSILCNQILQKVIKQKVTPAQGTVVDYISDSFYPVDSVSPYKQVASGTRIYKDGTICKDNSGNAILYKEYKEGEDNPNPGTGTIWQDATSGSWYVQWDQTSIAGTTESSQSTETWTKGRTSYSNYYKNSYTSGGKTYTWQTHEGVTAYWCVETTTTTTETENKFTGRVYLKAKEDFIGGNAINTNGNKIDTELDKARGISSENGAVLTMSTGGKYVYDKPTVNVRLLPMNQQTTEVTVAKGTYINGGTDQKDNKTPEGSVKVFFDDVAFTKLVAGTDKVTNKASQEWPSTEDEEGKTFSLGYASVTLTDAQWETLKSGGQVEVEYTYDESEGVVGKFTISLATNNPYVTVDGVTQTPEWDSHKALVEKGKPNGQNTTTESPYGDNWIENYTLNVTYTAYKLNENGRPNENRFNGDAGAGTPVGTGTTLENGKGTVESENIHYVYAYPVYELPETGGTGTLPFELGGSAVLLASMFAGCSMWRRRRDGRRCE